MIVQSFSSDHEVIDDLTVADIVDRELKNSVTEDERDFLFSSFALWRSHLLRLKKRTEMQFTSSKARRFSLYCDHTSGSLSLSEYLDKLLKEREWRCNAARYLQQIELKLQELKVVSDE